MLLFTLILSLLLIGNTYSAPYNPIDYELSEDEEIDRDEEVEPPWPEDEFAKSNNSISSPNLTTSESTTLESESTTLESESTTLESESTTLESDSTSLAPMTSDPTTLALMTSNLTTLAPTTSDPISLAPTTSDPTTLAPTTSDPTSDSTVESLSDLLSRITPIRETIIHRPISIHRPVSIDRPAHPLFQVLNIPSNSLVEADTPVAHPMPFTSPVIPLVPYITFDITPRVVWQPATQMKQAIPLYSEYVPTLPAPFPYRQISVQKSPWMPKYVPLNQPSPFSYYESPHIYPLRDCESNVPPSTSYALPHINQPTEYIDKPITFMDYDQPKRGYPAIRVSPAEVDDNWLKKIASTPTEDNTGGYVDMTSGSLNSLLLKHWRRPDDQLQVV